MGPGGAPDGLPRIGVMKLANPVTAVSLAERAKGVGGSDVDVANLAYDSRKAGPGTLFFCVVGEKRDGHDFAAQVVEAGATALVGGRGLGVAGAPARRA